MAADKRMELLMRIRAEGQEALARLKMFEHQLGKMGSSAKSFGIGAARGFRMAANGVNMMLTPLKVAAGATAGLAAGFSLLSAHALNSSGNMESLRLRLEGITKSKEEADRVFKETMELSIKSPFEPQELVDARIGLINIGMSGADAMTAVGDAASLTQKPLLDLVSMVASMETEPLRRIGIESKREARKFEFAFRDKMGTVKKITAKGIDDARQELLKIFEVKYGGGMTNFASAWKGITSTIKGNLALASADFGDGLMPVAKDFAQEMNNKLTELIESGALKEWGAAAAEKIASAFDYARAVVEKFVEVWGSLKTEGPEAMAEALKIAMATAAEMLVTGILTYLQAGSAVFVGLAKMMSGAFKEDIVTFMAGTVGFKGKAREMAMISMGSMGSEKGDELAKSLGYRSGDELFKAVSEGTASESTIGKVAGASGVGMFQSGIEEFTKELPQLGKNLQAAWGNQLAIAGRDINAIAPGTGPSVQERYSELQAERQERMAPREVMVTAARRKFVRTSNADFGRYVTQEASIKAGEGDYKVGQRVGDAVVIRVENLTVRANDTKRLQNELLARTNKLAQPAAAT